VSRRFAAAEPPAAYLGAADTRAAWQPPNRLCTAHPPGQPGRVVWLDLDGRMGSSSMGCGRCAPSAGVRQAPSLAGDLKWNRRFLKFSGCVRRALARGLMRILFNGPQPAGWAEWQAPITRPFVRLGRQPEPGSWAQAVVAIAPPWSFGTHVNYSGWFVCPRPPRISFCREAGHHSHFGLLTSPYLCAANEGWPISSRASGV